MGNKNIHVHGPHQMQKFGGFRIHLPYFVMITTQVS